MAAAILAPRIRKQIWDFHRFGFIFASTFLILMAYSVNQVPGAPDLNILYVWMQGCGDKLLLSSCSCCCVVSCRVVLCCAVLCCVLCVARCVLCVVCIECSVLCVCCVLCVVCCVLCVCACVCVCVVCWLLSVVLCCVVWHCISHGWPPPPGGSELRKLGMYLRRWGRSLEIPNLLSNMNGDNYFP